MFMLLFGRGRFSTNNDVMFDLFLLANIWLIADIKVTVILNTEHNRQLNIAQLSLKSRISSLILITIQ